VTEKNSSTETSQAPASAVDLQEGIGASAAGADPAPSLPMAYESWGEALAAHGELSPAIEKFRAAQELALSDSNRQIVAHHLAIESR
jgi:hypothetical protein